MQFIMLVGMPGSGKSTLAQDYISKGYVWYSPDNIRNELDIHEPERIVDILDIMITRMKVDLEAGKNIIYDSTNLTRRRRAIVLDIVENYNYQKICIVVITNLDICKERNSHRVGYSKVPNGVYDQMESIYREPTYSEGWDEIIYKEN